MTHDDCNGPEVMVCKHVSAGQPYDILSLSDDTGRVGEAFCFECADRMVQASNDTDIQRAVEVFACLTDCICRHCAREFGVPDCTPDGAPVWVRGGGVQ